MTNRKTLSELVVEERLCDESGALAAERQARVEGIHLTVALTEMGKVPESALVAALERRLRLSLVELSSETVDLDAVAAVPRELALRHLFLPLELKRAGGRVLLRAAMANPLDAEALQDIEYATGFRVEAVLAAPSALVEALAYHYRSSRTKVMHNLVAGARPDNQVYRTDPAIPIENMAPTTVPYHRTEDEAPCELRLKALLNVLVSKGVLMEEEYLEEVRRLLREPAAK